MMTNQTLRDWLRANPLAVVTDGYGVDYRFNPAAGHFEARVFDGGPWDWSPSPSHGHIEGSVFSPRKCASSTSITQLELDKPRRDDACFTASRNSGEA